MIAVAILGMAASVHVTPASFADAKEPQIAIDRNQQVYVAYGMGDAVYVSRSRTKGDTFESPVQIAVAQHLALGMRRGPRIAVADGVVTVSFASHQDGNLVAFSSRDFGRTWNGPARINDVAGSASEGLHAMAAAPDGTLACTWLDHRTKGTKLYLSTSKTGGTTWSPNRLVYASPSGSICECCHPSIAFDSKGEIHVMFRNSLQGSRDMYVTSSLDLGRTWSSATKLGTGTWILSACPMDGGSFAFSKTDALIPVWRRNATLYRDGLGAPESSFAEGRQPWIAEGLDGDYLVWTDGTQILSQTPTQKLVRLAAQGDDPVVSASPNGQLVIASWTRGGIIADRLK